MGLYIYASVYYGWFEPNDSHMGYDDIISLYQNLEMFTCETNKGYPLCIGYGVPCSLNRYTGQIEINEATKDCVHRAYYMWCEKRGMNPDERDIQFTPGMSAHEMYGLSQYSL